MKSTTPLAACTGGLRLGGSTTFLINLAWAFRERGLELPVISMSDDNEMDADFASVGVSVRVLSRRRLIYEDRIAGAYAEVARKHPAAVLACLGSDSFEVLPLLPPNVLRLGIIQSDDPNPYQCVRHFAPWLDAVVGVSTLICEKLSRDSPPFRVKHIPYGIRFGPTVARPLRDISRPVRIIYVGRIIEIQKRISRLVELAEVLAARGERFEFTFAGAGPALASSVERLKPLSNVRFLGEVPNAQVAGLLQSNDLFVLLSDYEGLPLSLLEAMGHGLVPVVSDLSSGIRDAVTGETGVRVPVGDVKAAADAISQLARDPSRLAALSRAASQVARQGYSAETMAARYLELIDELRKGTPVWGASTEVPAPVLISRPWLYRGWPRRMRRCLKRVISSAL